MDIYTHLREKLQSAYDQGATDQEIADRLGCSHHQINHLRNGKRSFSKMRLETLLKLFPGLQVSLDGSPLHGSYQSVNGNGNIVAGRDAHASATPCAAAVESFRSGLLEGVIDLDIDDAAKVAILRYVRDFRRQA